MNYPRQQSDAVRIAILETNVTNLSESIKGLTAEIKVLTNVMNQGKGAFAIAMVVAGAVGGIATKLAGTLLARL